MKLIESTQVTEGISYSAGYSHNCSVMIVHGKPKGIPNIEKIHYHTEDSEYYYVLKGKMTINVKGKDVEVRETQCLEVEPREAHKIVDMSNNVEYLIVRTNNLPGEKVIVGLQKFP